MLDWSYLSIFLIGLLAGTPHCAAMCGGVVSMLSANVAIDSSKIGHSSSRSTWTHLRFLLAYNVGRMITYIFIGAMTGWLGSLFVGREGIVFISPYLRLIPPILMIALGLYVAGFWFGITRLEKLGKYIWSYLEPYSRQFIPVKTTAQALFLGSIWGWLPCGLIYSTTLAYALPSGDALTGGLIMLFFGLGTMPVLLSVGVLSKKIITWVKHDWVKRGVGLSIVIFAFFDLLRAIPMVLSHSM